MVKIFFWRGGLYTIVLSILNSGLYILINRIAMSGALEYPFTCTFISLNVLDGTQLARQLEET